VLASENFMVSLEEIIHYLLPEILISRACRAPPARRGAGSRNRQVVPGEDMQEKGGSWLAKG
jgi:hypothetical protein